MANKLFIPGPTEVREEILNEMSNKQIGHRTQEFRELFASLKPGLKKLFYTNNDVLISTSTGSGFWEGSIEAVLIKKCFMLLMAHFQKNGQRFQKDAEKELR